MKRTLILLSLISVLFSCKITTTYKEEKFDGFSLKIANFLTASKSPVERSSAYYEDTLNNFVMMVVKESKDTMIAYGLKYDLHSYFTKTYNSLASKLTDGKMSIENPNSYADTIGPFKAIVGKISGSVNEDALIYFLTIVETKRSFYQIIYGMPKDQENRYTASMEEMRKSFREN